MFAAIRAIEYHLPAASVSNDDLAAVFADWSPGKIESKTGIAERRIAATSECSSDLAVAAAQKLFAGGSCQARAIDFVLLCTQSPDYFLPTTACLVQDRLGIPTTAGALDFNLGCSGFVYGLSLAKGLIETGQARNVLLLTAETYSKFLAEDDRSVRPLFGDAAAATLIQATSAPARGPLPWLGPFVFGTDGRGKDNLIVAAGGMRQPACSTASGRLYMNGPEIFTFTLQAVPQAVAALVDRAHISLDDVDLFVFHQANRYMLDHLREKIGIPADKFVLAMKHVGNTVSSTIPIALKSAQAEGRLTPGKLIMLVGFGVGYSWAATMLRT